MNPQDIKINDWTRIFIGDVPPVFFIEIVLRIVFVYLVIMISMRLLGKRMASQMTRNEFAALVSLSAAVGVPILAPDRGLLPAAVIALVVVGVSRLIEIVAARNPKVEKATQGAIDLLLKDGVLDAAAVRRTQVTRTRIFSELRSNGISNLAQVKRMYIESTGKFSLIRMKPDRPGLSLIPDEDVDMTRTLKQCPDVMVCHFCGNRRLGQEKQCGNCQADDWVRAVSV
jgi:uncharacterized membrane protein YcaP (DUF421 family)